jgi:hypothetical protein
MPTLSLSPDFGIFTHTHETCLEYYGEDITVTADMVPGSKHLFIRGDRVRLSADISLPGRTVAIFCRTLVCDAKRTIDVSGAKPGAKLARAKSGTAAGEAGSNGVTGNAGASAGQIRLVADSLEGTLILRANGGAGQEGQDGGSGAIGGAGLAGKSGKPFSKKPVGYAYKDGEPGKQGKKGGAAGTGGAGGAGGTAGIVHVSLVGAPAAKQVLVQAEPGPGGGGGLPGDAGGGGPGGLGGFPLNVTTEKVPLVDNDWEMGWDELLSGSLQKKRLPTGPVGPKGDAGRVGPQGGWGASKYGTPPKLNYTKCVETTSFKAIKANLRAPQLGLLMNAATREYLCGAYDAARERLLWLHQVLGAPGEPGSERLKEDPSPVLTGAALNEVSTAVGRVQLLLDQLARGLDVYGMPRDYVPLQSLTTWFELFEHAVRVLADAESTAKDFNTALGDLKATRSALRRASDASASHIAAMNQSLEPLRVELDRADRTIANLLAARERCTAEIEGASDDFKAALIACNKKKGGSCDLKKTLQVVSTLVAVATGVGTAYTAFSTALALASGGPDLPGTGLENIQGLVSYARTVYGKIDGGVDALQAALKKLEGIAARDPMIAVDQKHLDAILDEYRALPEAQRYRALIDDLVLKSQAVNEASLTRDAIAARINETVAGAHVMGQERAQIQDQLAVTGGSVDVHAARFIASLLEQLRRDCLWALAMEARSLNFRTLSSVDPDLSYTSAVALRGAQARMQVALAKIHDQYTSVMQAFETHEPLTISQGSEDGARLLSELRERRTMVFRVELSARVFAGYSHVTVDEVIVSLDHFKVSGATLHVKLTHLGDARSTNSAGQVFTHSYRPRSTTTVLDAETGRPLTPGLLIDERERPSQLAPFGTWTLELPGENGLNPDLDLSGLTEVRVRFKAHGRTRSA